VSRPTVLRIGTIHRRVGEIEHFLVITFSFGELAVVPAERVVEISFHVELDRSVGVEECPRRDPRLADHIVETVPAQEEEAVLSTCRVESVELIVDVARDVDCRNQRSRSCHGDQSRPPDGPLSSPRSSLSGSDIAVKERPSGSDFAHRAADRGRKPPLRVASPFMSTSTSWRVETVFRLECP
jgi:hypothetical protein